MDEKGKTPFPGDRLIDPEVKEAFKIAIIRSSDFRTIRDFAERFAFNPSTFYRVTNGLQNFKGTPFEQPVLNLINEQKQADARSESAD